MPDINRMTAGSGRRLKENNTVVNVADKIEAIAAALDLPIPTTLAGSLIPTHSKLTVTTASQTALATNTNRKYAMLINDSDTVIYLKINAAAVLNEGIRINPNGGVFEMSSAIGNLHTGAINAIHGGTGNKNLLILEGV